MKKTNKELKFEIQDNKYYINNKEVSKYAFESMIQECNDKKDKITNWAKANNEFAKSVKNINNNKENKETLYLSENQDELNITIDRIYNLSKQKNRNNFNKEAREMLELLIDESIMIGYMEALEQLGSSMIKMAGTIEQQLNNDYDNREIE
jgi:hypothetical protein